MSILFVTGAELSVLSNVPATQTMNNPLFLDPSPTMNDLVEIDNKAVPSTAHNIVSDMMSKHGGLVFTSNIDSLHEKSGIPSENIYHIYGSVKDNNLIYPGEFPEPFPVEMEDTYYGTAFTVIIGTSFDDPIPLYFISPTNPIILVAKDANPTLAILRELYPFPPPVSFYEGDITVGIKKVQELLKGHTGAIPMPVPMPTTTSSEGHALLF